MAETGHIDLVVITPDRQVVHETADAVVIPAHDGEIGILHDRAALMCELGIGQLRYSQGALTHRYFIDGGFAQVFDNHVSLLTSRALPADKVTADVVAETERTLGEQQGHDLDTLAARQRTQRRLSVLRGLQR